MLRRPQRLASGGGVNFRFFALIIASMMCFVAWFLNRALYNTTSVGVLIAGGAFLFVALLQLLIFISRLLKSKRVNRSHK